MVIFCQSSNTVIGQTPLALYGGGQSTLYQYNSKIGISSLSITSDPLFKVEQVTSLGQTLGSIKQLYSLNGIQYGLYQTGSSMKNLFEGEVQCMENLTFLGEFSKIGLSNRITEFPFEYIAAGVTSTVPLTIKPTGIVVQGLIESDNFQMHTGATTGWILMSDNSGNGSWVNPSSFNDNDWLRTKDNDLYSNSRRIGIGSTTPRGKLEVVNSTADASKYAIILNQQDDQTKAIELRFDYLDQEKWAIGQRFVLDDPARNSFFIWNHQRSEYSLLVDGTTGNIGIGTVQPGSLLDINGNLHSNSISIGTYAIVRWSNLSGQFFFQI